MGGCITLHVMYCCYSVEICSWWQEQDFGRRDWDRGSELPRDCRHFTYFNIGFDNLKKLSWVRRTSGHISRSSGFNRTEASVLSVGGWQRWRSVREWVISCRGGVGRPGLTTAATKEICRVLCIKLRVSGVTCPSHAHQETQFWNSTITLRIPTLRSNFAFVWDAESTNIKSTSVPILPFSSIISPSRDSLQLLLL